MTDNYVNIFMLTPLTYKVESFTILNYLTRYSVMDAYFILNIVFASDPANAK